MVGRDGETGHEGSDVIGIASLLFNFLIVQPTDTWFLLLGLYLNLGQGVQIISIQFQYIAVRFQDRILMYPLREMIM